MYDVIIVGGGVAGLRIGIEALKAAPRLKCCILEKYWYIGGRVVTFRKNIPTIGEVQWENGAGRISTSHKKVLKLLDEYKLSFVPIEGRTCYIDDREAILHENTFADLVRVYLEPLERLSPETLRRHTIKELLDKTVGPKIAKEFYEQFGYYSEIHIMRADVSLDLLKNELRSNYNFGTVGEGYSALIDKMAAEFIRLGGKIIMDRDVYKVTSNTDNSITVKYKIRNSVREGSHTGRVVVLALHQAALKKIDGVNNLPVLRYMSMKPLLRMYAVFPTRNKTSWFTGLDNVVTNSPIRNIIPIDAEQGIVMISYTDDMDAKWWNRLKALTGDNKVKEAVMAEIRKLFPDRVIPDPIYFKQHPWQEGCTYWLPGSYNVVEESNKSIRPKPNTMPHLFMCGESFAVRQCWVESALDQADKLLSNRIFNHLITARS